MRIVMTCPDEYVGARRVAEDGAALGLWKFEPLERLSIPMEADLLIFCANHPAYHLYLDHPGLPRRKWVLWTSPLLQTELARVEMEGLLYYVREPRVERIWFGERAASWLFPGKAVYAPYPVHAEGVMTSDDMLARSPFAETITDMGGEPPPKEGIGMFLPFGNPQKNVYNQLCVSPGTIVLGGNEPIETLAPGDSVLGERRDEVVLNTVSRAYEGPVVNISMEGLPQNVSLTPAHPVLVAAFPGKRAGAILMRNRCHPSSVSWKAASEIRRGDYVACPRGGKRSRPFWLEYRTGGKGIRHSGPSGQRDRRAFKRRRLGEATAWLLGLFVAEGSSDGVNVDFALGHQDEVRGLVGRLTGVLAKLGLKHRLYRRGNSLRVQFTNRDLAGFLRATCGHRADRKRLPDCVKEGSFLVLSSAIQGLLDGDGYILRGQHRITTVSRGLAYDLLEGLHRLGRPCSLMLRRTAGPGLFQGRAVNLKDRWDVGWSVNPQRTVHRAKVDGKFVYRRVKAVTQSPFAGRVHNLETSDGTYAVPFLVHNCAVRIFQESHPEVVLKTNGMLPEHKRFAEAVGLKYKDLGWLSRLDYYDQIAQCRLMLHCTLSESFAYSVMDAMLLNVPVLVGPSVTWVPGGLGLSCEPSDPAAISNAIAVAYFDQSPPRLRDTALGVARSRNEALRAAIAFW